MLSSFHSRTPEPSPTVEPVAIVFPEVKGGELAGATRGTQVGGDFYDSLRVSSERVLFGLLDVAGKREQNRNILLTAQTIFRELGAELFSKPDVNESEAMTEVCVRLNRGIMEAASGVHSCPAFIGCYNENFGTLCYTSAGHTPALIRDNTGISELAPTGLPLGLFSHAISDSPIIGLERGAALLLVSRGVVEGKCKEEKSEDLEFGLERVKSTLQNAPASDAADLCAFILNAVGEFTYEPLVHDDMSAMAFLRLP